MMSEVDEKTCPYCAERIRVEAIKCPHCGSVVDRTVYLKSWKRLPKEGKLLGICAGLSKKLDIEAVYVRVAFVIGALIGGLGILLYLILWLLMPRASGKEGSPPAKTDLSPAGKP